MPGGLPPAARRKLARGLFRLPLMEATFDWRVGGANHSVHRFGFALTHAAFLTVTASQGRTLRTRTTIDCARLPPAGLQGTNDDEWWLNLYVMFSRVTQMEDLRLLRPPQREQLERGPPAHVLAALKIFAARERATLQDAEAFASALGAVLPAEGD